MEICAACGAKTQKLLEVYAGTEDSKRLPFCIDCVEFGACALPLLVQDLPDGTTLARSVVESNSAMLRVLRRSRLQTEAYQARVAKLEAMLSGRDRLLADEAHEPTEPSAESKA
jgi:hypothetical protein